MEKCYKDLLDEYYDRRFTDEEMTLLETELKNRVRAGKNLTYREQSILLDLYYYDDGAVTEHGKHGWIVLEQILRLDKDEYYLLSNWYHEDYGHEYTDEVPAVRVYYKPIRTMDWVKEDDPRIIKEED